MRLLIQLVKLCLVLTVICSGSSFANGVDPLLVKALHHATINESLQTTDLQKLRWLSRMSAQLERTIPDPFYRIRLLKTVHQEAANVGIDPQLVLAVMDTESSFNRYALSRAGAKGLMQVMPFWKKVLGQPDADLFNPLTSIRFGCEVLRRYMDRYSTTEDALAAYNGSLGRSTYSDKVLSRFNSRWQYKDDIYENQIKVALTDQPAPGS